MHTKDILAGALREVGLTEMADKAATGYYHDFLSPLDLPTAQLVDDLTWAAARDQSLLCGDPIRALRERVKHGDFDASEQESNDWAMSDEAQEIFGSMLTTKGNA
jgi:hypothetical protein